MAYINQIYCAVCQKITPHDYNWNCLYCTDNIQKKLLQERLDELSKLSLEERIRILESQINQFLMFENNKFGNYF